MHTLAGGQDQPGCSILNCENPCTFDSTSRFVQLSTKTSTLRDQLLEAFIKIMHGYLSLLRYSNSAFTSCLLACKFVAYLFFISHHLSLINAFSELGLG